MPPSPDKMGQSTGDEKEERTKAPVKTDIKAANIL